MTLLPREMRTLTSSGVTSMFEFLFLLGGVCFMYALLWCIRENEEMNNG
jgi:hypothetical protein